MSSIYNHNTRHDQQYDNTFDVTSSPPPWEVLVLVSHHLEPKSLATASCVSRSWSACFSSEHLWSPLCSTHFPSLFSLSSATTTTSLRCLYALGHAARRLRHRTPTRPKLPLDRLLFTLSIHTTAKSLTVVKPCKDLDPDPHGLFRFDVEVEERKWAAEELREARLTWNIVMVGEAGGEWKGVFTMAEERGGKGGFATSSGVDGWFSEELPPPPGMMSSGLVADLRLRMVAVEEGPWGCRRRESRVTRIEKISVGVISLRTWGYVKIDDVLAYLEHFLPLS